MKKLNKIAYLLLFPVCLFSFNVIVNPYSQWNLPRIPGFNDKLTETSWDPFIKTYQIQHQHYDTVILGSSRAAIALSSQHPAFATHKTYNYGLSGAGIHLQYLTLEHALQQHPIKQVIFTPDFFGFNAYSKLNQPGIYGHAGVDRLFYQKNQQAYFSGLFEQGANTFANNLGWRGTNSSIRTLISQNQKTVYIDKNGNWKRFGTKDKSYRKQYDRTEKVFLTDLLFPTPEKSFSFVDANSRFNSFQQYEKLLRLAYAHQLNFTALLLPTPTRDLLALNKLHLWPQYQHWKKQIVHINESLAKEYKVEPFSIWDFEHEQSQLNSDVLEDLAAYFYEPFHPTALTGEQTLNRIFLNCAEVTCWPGERLTTHNVDTRLQQLENALNKYPAQYPQQFAQLQNNLKKTQDYRRP